MSSTGPGREWAVLTSARKEGGADTGPSPVDRQKMGSKHHLICDGRGTLLKVITTAATVNDVTQTLALVDGIPAVAGRPGADLNPRSVARATTPIPTATPCGTDESCSSSHAGDPRTSRASASSATSSSRPSPCSTTSNASPSDGDAAPNSTMPSSPSPAV